MEIKQPSNEQAMCKGRKIRKLKTFQNAMKMKAKHPTLQGTIYANSKSNSINPFIYKLEKGHKCRTVNSRKNEESTLHNISREQGTINLRTDINKIGTNKH